MTERLRTIAACHKSVADEIEADVMAVWRKLDSIGLEDRSLVIPHRSGLLECRDKLNAILREG